MNMDQSFCWYVLYHSYPFIFIKGLVKVNYTEPILVTFQHVNNTIKNANVTWSLESDINPPIIMIKFNPITNSKLYKDMPLYYLANLNILY